MKKLFLLLLISSICSFYSYGEDIPKKLKKKYAEIEKIDKETIELYRVKVNGKFGLVDKKDKVIMPSVYDWLSVSEVYRETSPYKFYVSATLNGKEALFDINGKELFPFIYESVRLDYEEDSKYLYVSVKKNGKWGICQMDGKEIFPCEYESAFLDYEKDSKYLSARVKKNGKEGICNLDGKEIIPCEYESAYVRSTIQGHIPYVSIENNDKKKGICNIDGEILVPCKYESAWLDYLEEADFFYAKVANGEDKQGICTLDGKEVMPCKYKFVNVDCEEKSGLLYIKKYNGKYGVSDINGNEVIPCEYDIVGMCYDEETESNYYLATNISDKLFVCKHLSLSGRLIKQTIIERNQSDLTQSESEQPSQMSKLEKTATVLQILAAGMQNMTSYMNISSSRNIYGTSYTRQQQTCSFCKGTGNNPKMERPPFYSSIDDPMNGSCNVCGDKSNHYHKICPSCKGRGYK